MRITLLKVVLISTLMNCFFLASFSQSQTSKVASVTITIDTIQNVAQMETAQRIITSHAEVGNFDIKLRKCNFTLDNSSYSSTYNKIKNDLENAGFAVALIQMKANQVFTNPSIDNCDTRHPARKNDPDK